MATQEELLIQIRDALYLILSKDGFLTEKLTPQQKQYAKVTETEQVNK